jgi:hypothetical protein
MVSIFTCLSPARRSSNDTTAPTLCGPSAL